MRSEWVVHQLADYERDGLSRSVATVSSDPYQDLPAFAREATLAWASLAPATRDLVADLVSGTSARPELCLTNLPDVAQLPPTPTATTSWARLTRGCTSELVMMAFTAGLGSPISYLDQRDASIFHDVYPTRRNATAVSSQSSSVDLGMHTEMFFHPEPPDFLLLHCLRSTPDRPAHTNVASLADIEAKLGAEDRATLREPLFAHDLARLHGRYTIDGRPYGETDPRPCVPIITESSTGTRLRFEPGLTTPMTDAAAQALRRAEYAAEAVAARGVLAERCLLIVDNRRAAHSRSSFTARFDGSDRWLRRMMVTTTDTAAPGAVERHDLELVRSWRQTGAIVQSVPYTLAQEA